MTISLLILLVVLISLATWRPSQHRDAAGRGPIHPYLRHLTDDPEVRRDWRVS